ncbi:MAG: DnaD domain protein [Clostridiales bacterium]
MKKKQDSEIMLDILVDTTSIPNILLEYYKEFKLSEIEVIFLINLLRWKQKGISLDIESLNENTGYAPLEISQMVTDLIEKGFVSMNKKGFLNLNCFFDKMREAWGWQEAKVMRIAGEKDMVTDIDKEFSYIYKKFQEEMGRPLSGIEGEQIKDWFSTLSMGGELIYEALKKAVLLDKRNFQYINKILLDWHSKGYKNLKDLEKETKKYTPKQNDKKVKNKFREDQDANIFEDVFEVD